MYIILRFCPCARSISISVCIYYFDTACLSDKHHQHVRNTHTHTSASAYMTRKSCMTQSMYSSPVPYTTCSPDSSTWCTKQKREAATGGVESKGAGGGRDVVEQSTRKQIGIVSVHASRLCFHCILIYASASCTSHTP